MVLVRVDDELRVDPLAFQRHVHLLAAGDRHVHVPLTTKEQRRCLDPVRLPERVGELVPQFLVRPRLADLVVVLEDVLVGPIHRRLQGAPGAARRRLEARRGRDRVVRQDAAVAPPTDAQARRVGHADGDRVIDRGQEVLHFLVPPVGVNRLLVFRAPAGAAAIVHRQDDVAVRRKELALEAERVLVLRVRSAVDAQQRRVAGAGLEGRGLHHEPVDHRAVTPPRREVLGGRELHRLEPGGVFLRQGAHSAGVEREDFVRLCGRAGHDRDPAIRCERERRDRAPSLHEPGHRAIADAHARQVVGAVVLHLHHERRPVAGPHR